MKTPTPTQDGWTSEAPTVAGVYEWKAEEGSTVVCIHSLQYGSLRLNKASQWPGLWRRLVPAVEVERAYQEGGDHVCQLLNLSVYVGAKWNQSRAKKVMEGGQ